MELKLIARNGGLTLWIRRSLDFSFFLPKIEEKPVVCRFSGKDVPLNPAAAADVV